MEPTSSAFRLYAIGLMLALPCLGPGCTIDTTDEDGGQICTIQELEEMMEVCASYGGDFVGETTDVTTIDCLVGVEAMETIVGFEGACAIEVSSECIITCDFPDGVQSPDDE